MKLNDCYKEGLLRKTKPSKDIAYKSLETSNTYITKAEDNFKIKNYDLVMFCSYTAMFHAARAILFKDGIKERSHICIISYIQETYPPLKILVNVLDSYRRNRHNTLYALDFLITKDDAQQAIDDAKLFNKQISGFISNTNK